MVKLTCYHMACLAFLLYNAGKEQAQPKAKPASKKPPPKKAAKPSESEEEDEDDDDDDDEEEEEEEVDDDDDDGMLTLVLTGKFNSDHNTLESSYS